MPRKTEQRAKAGADEPRTLGALTALPRSFYERPILQVTRGLMGCLLVHERERERLVGRIVEAEAYGGLVDAASHSFRGPTPRCRSMFGPRGHAYVYRIYGIHHCMNVAAGDPELAGAILLRAVEPIEGLKSMRERRAGRKPRELCRGPGRLSAAYGLDTAADGLPLSRGSGLWISPGPAIRGIRWTPRIGLGNNDAAHWLWRCVDPDSKYASPTPQRWPRAARPRPAAARRDPRLQQGAGRARVGAQAS